MNARAVRLEEPMVAPDSTHTLDSLAALSAAALAALYGQGTAPESLAALDGHPAGRMLAVAGLDGAPAAALLRRLSGARWFPWAGKSFQHGSARAGRGVNRLHLGGRHALFPFETTLSASVVDGAPAVVLDYDLPDNPGFIRAIHDEVRLVSRGVYLGPAMWKTPGGPRHVLWFALDTGRQATAVGSR